MEKEKPRNSNIELLRLFALYGVLILHYMHNGGGCGFAIDFAIANGIETPFFMILRGFFMQSADLFFIIFGYCAFRSRKITWKKPLLLILTVITGNLIHYAVNLLLGYGKFSFADLIFSMTPADYFVVLYCVLYLFSPYINRFLEMLSDRELLRFVIASFLCFSVWSFVIDALAAPTDSAWWRFLNPVGPVTTQHGYTILNCFLLYVLGAFCSRTQIAEKLSRTVWLLLYLAGSAGTFLLSNTGMDLDVVYSYNGPFVLINAFALLNLFTSFDFQSQWVNRLAKPVFFIYTFHWGIFGLLGIEQVMQTGNHLLIVLHGLLVPAAVYLVCIPAYLLYRLYMRPLLGRPAGN